jgi:hypothetical protein
VFIPGEVVDPDDLNNLVDLATALPAIITDPSHAAITPATGDKILLVHAGALAQADISALPGAGTVTSVNWDTLNPTPTTIFSGGVTNSTIAAKITFGLKNQNPNVFLAGPASGTTGSTPGFRALVPKDTETLHSISATTIDCSIGNAFSKVLTAPTNTFLLQNGIAGQIVKIWLRQYSGHGTVAWNTAPATLYWRGGTVPVMNTTAGNVDIYTFFFTGPEVFGYSDQNFS